LYLFICLFGFSFTFVFWDLVNKWVDLWIVGKSKTNMVILQSCDGSNINSVLNW
jgi:hypothetical protein